MHRKKRPTETSAIQEKESPYPFKLAAEKLASIVASTDQPRLLARSIRAPECDISLERAVCHGDPPCGSDLPQNHRAPFPIKMSPKSSLRRIPPPRILVGKTSPKPKKIGPLGIPQRPELINFGHDLILVARLQATDDTFNKPIHEVHGSMISPIRESSAGIHEVHEKCCRNQKT